MVFRGHYVDTVGTFALMERTSDRSKSHSNAALPSTAAAPSQRTSGGGAKDCKAGAGDGGTGGGDAAALAEDAFSYVGQSTKRCRFSLVGVVDESGA